MPTFTQAAISAMSTSGKSPMTIAEIAEGMRRVPGYSSHSDNFHGLVRTMLRHNEDYFQRVGRGLYALTPEAKGEPQTELTRASDEALPEAPTRIFQDLLNHCPMCGYSIHSLKESLSPEVRSDAIVRCPQCKINLAAIQEALCPEIQLLDAANVRLLFARLRSFVQRT